MLRFNKGKKQFEQNTISDNNDMVTYDQFVENLKTWIKASIPSKNI